MGPVLGRRNRWPGVGGSPAVHSNYSSYSDFAFLPGLPPGWTAAIVEIPASGGGCPEQSARNVKGAAGVDNFRFDVFFCGLDLWRGGAVGGGRDLYNYVVIMLFNSLSQLLSLCAEPLLPRRRANCG